MKLSSHSSIIRLALSALLAFSLTLSAYAQASWARDPYLEALSKSKDELSVSEFLHLALIFSGADQSLIPQYEQKILTDIDQIRTHFEAIEDEYKRAEMLLDYLHRDLLKKYSALDTKIDVLIGSGLYNCVSSSVMYMAYAKALSFNIKGVVTIDHAFCAIMVNNAFIDVETTNRNGFDPGTKKEFLDSFGKATGYAYVPQKNYAQRTDVDERKLLTLILQNRIVEYERSQIWDKAVALAFMRYNFINDAESTEYLAERFANQAGTLVNNKKWESAFAVLDNALALLGKGIKTLDSVVDLAIHNRLAKFIDERDYEGLESFIVEAKTKYGDRKDFEELQALALRNRIIELTQKNKWEDARILVSPSINEKTKTELLKIIDESEFSYAVLSFEYVLALQKIEKIYSFGTIREDRYEEALAYLVAKEANRVAKKDGYLEAIAVSEKGLKIMSKSAKLQKLRDVMVANYISESHSKFASFFNDRKYKEAQEILDAALFLYPDNAILKKDATYLKKALAGS